MSGKWLENAWKKGKQSCGKQKIFEKKKIPILVINFFGEKAEIKKKISTRSVNFLKSIRWPLENLANFEGRIGNLISIHDYEHANYLMEQLSKEWPEESEQDKKCTKYKAKIEEGFCKGLKRSSQSATLQRFLKSGPSKPFQHHRRVQVERVGQVYRSGPQKYYTYLLINLEILESEEMPSFQTFLESVFYIGKGVDRRSRHHGRDALKVSERQLRFESRKIITIRRILDSSRGAIGIVETNHESTEKQALGFEHCMIVAMGLAALTNAKTENMPQVGGEKEEDPEYTDKKAAKVTQAKWTTVQIETIGTDRLLE